MISRKEEFVKLVKEGKTNSEIAKTLGITEQSASTYYKRYGITRNYVGKMGEHVAQIEFRELQQEIPKDRRIDGTPLFTQQSFGDLGGDLLEVKKDFEITVKGKYFVLTIENNGFNVTANGANFVGCFGDWAEYSGEIKRELNQLERLVKERKVCF